MAARNQKPVVAVDVDDVLVPHASHLINFINRSFGRQIQLDKFFEFDEIVQLAGGDEKELTGRINRFLQSVEFSGLEPVEEAVQVINRLQRKYVMVVVTARPLIVEEITRKWLKQHFPQAFRSVHFVNLGWAWGRGHRSSKVDVCQATGASILIDDNLHHIQDAVQSGMKGLLFGDYPWNQAEKLPRNVTRVKNWHGIVQALL